MFNCTDVVCVLHHHHFYAQLYHLKHPLPDDTKNHAFEEGEIIDDDESTQQIVKGSDEVIYIICGVIIAMVVVGLVIILVAITINKLRKRDEFSMTPSTAIEGPALTLHVNFAPNLLNGGRDGSSESQHLEQQTTFTNQSVNNGGTADENNSNTKCLEQQHVTFVRTNVVDCSSAANSNWVFPPKAPTPNIYSCLNSDMLETANNGNGFKGFRKQFSGRFKRLVTKKTETVSAIPPELKPQLKTIYVY